MYLDMKIDLSSLDVHNNRATTLSPFVVNGEQAVDLHSIGIYGRRRYFTYVRNDWSTLGKEGDMISFGGLLGEAPVIPVSRYSPAVMINRGGRIPAPLQSLKN